MQYNDNYFSKRETSNELMVLSFLNGKKYDDSAKEVIKCLRPSLVRVCPPLKDEIQEDGKVIQRYRTLEGIPWRVSVYLNDFGDILYIKQEGDYKFG